MTSLESSLIISLCLTGFLYKRKPQTIAQHHSPMFLFAASLVLAFILLQPTTSSGNNEQSLNCSVLAPYECPKEVKEPLFAKLEEIIGNLTYNCTLEDVSSVTANFGKFDEYTVLYDPIDNLNQTVYKENNTRWPTHRQEVLGGLNVTNFINNATKAWEKELEEMRNKTQVGCYLYGGYVPILVCAFT
ncbi:hypothetical protein Y032_0283g1311 [Ancylostoma ceylanicum]|uniref:Uncharacterized protein n=2 Tax=Ancylostoma ceylanicum TaxID=53326 RepID=A0A016S6V8_9BILA|nr:hypothetical protein Y032_0283g1311 [Ancylostoma ceylanicum]